MGSNTKMQGTVVSRLMDVLSTLPEETAFAPKQKEEEADVAEAAELLKVRWQLRSF